MTHTTLVTIMRNLITNCTNEESFESNKDILTILILIETLIALLKTPMSLIKTILILMRVINFPIFRIETHRDSKTLISNVDY